MKLEKLSNMKKGWFIGNFTPSLIKTDDFEVAVKFYKKGEREEFHYHKIATEITVIVSGCVRMNGVDYSAGDIIEIPPCEGTDFEALQDVITTVVKLPSAENDKYVVDII